MAKTTQSPAPSFSRNSLKLLPWIVLSIGLAISTTFWQLSVKHNHELLEKKFGDASLNIVEALKERLETYELILHGMDGFYAGSKQINQDEFTSYVEHLHLKENYAGLLGIRYAELVPNTRKAEFIQSGQLKVDPLYTIWPEHNASYYAPILHAAPNTELNQATIGFDMLSDSSENNADNPYGNGPRSRALHTSAQTGDIAITDRLKLNFRNHTDDELGFAMFLPVYHQASSLEKNASPELRGWLGAVFRLDEFVNSVIKGHEKLFKEVEIHLYDESNLESKNRMYGSIEKTNAKRLFSKTLQLALPGGQQWTIQTFSRPAFDQHIDNKTPIAILLASIIFSLLATWATHLIVRIQYQKLNHTQQLADEGRKNETLLRAASDGIAIFDQQGNVVQMNQAMRDLTGCQDHTTCPQQLVDWYPEFSIEHLISTIRALDSHGPVFSALLKRSDGTLINVDVSAAALELDGEPLIYTSVRDVTERIQTEKALKESEERWAFALKGSAAGVWDWDMQTGHIVFAERYKNMLGFDNDVVWCALSDWSSRVNEQDMQRAMNALEDHMDGNTPNFSAEYRMLCKDGIWIWVQARGLIVSRTEEGRPLRMIVTHVDITETKRAAEALRHSESQLRLLLDSIAEAIYGIDLEGNCMFCNPACANLLGYNDSDELIGENMHKLIHSKLVDGTPQHQSNSLIYQAINNNKSQHSDTEVFWRADGTYIDVEYWVHPQVIDDDVVGGVVTFFDITERKKANEMLIKLSKAVENSPAGVVITDTKGIIEYVNKRFTELTDFTSQEVIGRNPRILNAGIQSSDFYRNMWDTIRSGREWSGELYNKRKSGQIYLERSKIAPIFDEKGSITHFVSVREDITEQKRIEEELQKSMLVAEAANKAKSFFLANMSHEIRTPMNAIIGLTHLCLQTQLTDKQHDYLNKTHNSAKALLGIINDILDFSKIEAGKMEIEQVSFQLDEVLNNLVTVISGRANEKGLEFLLEVGLDVPHRLEGDPMRLGQILINLASNAIKFTHQGEVLVSVRLESDIDNFIRLRFSIKDTGIGLSQEQIKNLFTAFSQADSSTTRKYGGTGLGLSICKQLVDLMGGKIWVESTPDQGSEFIFTATFRKAARQSKAKSILPQELRDIRILAVDDNATSRHILSTYLDAFNFEVTLAHDGLDAIDKFTQAEQEGHPFELVIADWKMPNMDGIELANALRGKAPTKILLNSAFGHGEMIRHLDDNLVDGILSKPFSQSGLFNAVNEVFGHSIQHKRTVSSLFSADDQQKVRGAHLLLVEDNQINQQVAQELLERAEISCVIANNGEEALKLVWQEKFDGILMDMQMPVMDGLTATRELRKNPRLANMPIIAMTANVMTSDREQCVAAGMNDHIAKPLEPSQMIATLAKWIKPSKPLSDDKTIGDTPTPPNINLPILNNVDVEDGVNRTGGSVAVFYKILSKFRIDQQYVINDIRNSMTHDEATAIRLSHTLKGLLGTIGAKTMREQALAIEQAIREADLAKATQLLNLLEDQLKLLFSEINTLCDKPAEFIEESTSALKLDAILPLCDTAEQQLISFDSGIDDTLQQLSKLIAGHNEHTTALLQVQQSVESYDYDTALNHLRAWLTQLRTLS